MYAFRPTPIGRRVAAPTGTYLLDVYDQGPHYAFGMTRLRAAFSGPVLTITRFFGGGATNGGSRQFSFVGDDLDQAAIVDWVTDGGAQPTADGYVTLWNDQTPNASFIEFKGGDETTDTPIIVENGALYTRDGKPSLRFDGGGFRTLRHFGPQGGIAGPALTMATVHSLTGGTRRTIFQDRIFEVRDDGAGVAEVNVESGTGFVLLASTATINPGDDVTIVATAANDGNSVALAGVANGANLGNGSGFGDVNMPIGPSGTGSEPILGPARDGSASLFVAWDNDYSAVTGDIRDYVQTNVI